MIQQKVHQKVNDIEEIELELTRFNARRALSSQDKRLEEIRIGSARLLVEATGPDSLYYNRVKGFGIADLEHLDQIVSEYEQRNTRPCFDMAPTRLNEQVALALHRKGFLPTDQLAFLEAEPAEAAAVHPDITIEPVDEGNVDVLLEAVSDLMGGVPADILARKKRYFTLPEFRNYLAYSDGQLAGIGSMFIHAGKGYLANDYTLPAFRGRGCQTTLIRHRLSEAKRTGLSTVYTDVVFGSSSHNHMLVQGFRHVYTNSFWVRDQ
ncbi:GNAT family N-acetyltransferase [Paenibacillus cellulositrophicus]|uniref:GNAT family N-acetyltransferase n=1 Tax=Paenibacillus cellulositrophicus TaxID=562959 RepID=UPI002041E258|nr:GNAT family N-acetyltransferase [Paenibacillus cellulositrophicus]MCM2998444.1 GNAT family N-acetyltransferase [Paenibacillus cellulositrophicus]